MAALFYADKSHYLVTSFEVQHYFENIYYYVICSLVLQVLGSL